MKKALALFFIIASSPVSVTASISDFLIVTNIGNFTASKNPSEGRGTGILAGVNHFDLDHNDITHEISYFNLQTRVGPEVQVTQHAGNDSDQWLLHEVEDAFRGNPKEDHFKGVIREINGNRIFTFKLGTRYSWISNNVVVSIDYTDLQKTKPEPQEIIAAYLQKHPSTIPPMVMDKSHDEQWIKDEMARRLWLGDKWFLQVQTGKVETDKVLKEAVDHMNLFLDYRQKYYGASAQEEKQALFGFLQAKDGTSIKKKLAEYKTWWEANKARAINLS